VVVRLQLKLSSFPTAFAKLPNNSFISVPSRSGAGYSMTGTLLCFEAPMIPCPKLHHCLFACPSCDDVSQQDPCIPVQLAAECVMYLIQKPNPGRESDRTYSTCSVSLSCTLTCNMLGVMTQVAAQATQSVTAGGTAALGAPKMA